MTGFLRFWRSHFLGLEAMVAAIPVIVFAVYLLAFDGQSRVDEFVYGNRTNIYRTVATIAGTLLGFSIAVASLVLNFVSSARLAVLRGSPQYPSLWKTFFQATRFLGALTLTALICLIWDRDTQPVTWLIVPVCLFAGLCVMRLLRVIWILEQIIGIVSKPSPDLGAAAEPTGWSRSEHA